MSTSAALPSNQQRQHQSPPGAPLLTAADAVVEIHSMWLCWQFISWFLGGFFRLGGGWVLLMTGRCSPRPMRRCGRTQWRLTCVRKTDGLLSVAKRLQPRGEKCKWLTSMFGGGEPISISADEGDQMPNVLGGGEGHFASSVPRTIFRRSAARWRQAKPTWQSEKGCFFSYAYAAAMIARTLCISWFHYGGWGGEDEVEQDTTYFSTWPAVSFSLSLVFFFF